MDKWQNSTAVVTGASAGIGKAITTALVKAGVNVVGLARRSEKVEALARELEYHPGKVYACKCDVADATSIKAAFKWIGESFGSVNILVNNAGILRNVRVLDTSDEAGTKLNEIINTNFSGLVQCTREAFKLMQKCEDYGYIINIGSVYGKSVPFLPAVEQSHNVYNPTKFAVLSLTEVIRQELIKLKCSRIRISTINPGLVETELYEMSDQSEEGASEMKKWPILKPESIADGVLYILSTPYSVNVTDLTIKPVGERI